MKLTMVNFFKKVWAAWKRVGQFIGDIIGRVVLTALYFTVVLPFAVGLRLTSDPLAIKPVTTESFWRSRPEFKDSLEEARRQ